MGRMTLQAGVFDCSAVAPAQAIARVARRRDVGSLGTPASRDARQAVATDRLLPSALLPGLLWQQQEAPLGLIVVT